MKRAASVFSLIVLAVAGCGCNRAPDNKDAVRQGVLDHLQKNAALDLNQLNVDVADVQFEGNRAVAKVAFKPKTAPDQGMSMSYTLERQGEKWVVQGRGAGHGGTGMGGGAPQAAPADPAGKGGELPAGHPPVNQAPPAK
ncbi:MAG TPA: hypothetical protein VES20_24380 [Bryobacteraceae bacterium]|nr:hypothetical protein [Bryobacteraceae bacterium]